MDWSGKKERARIAGLRDPREDEEWFRSLPEAMRVDMTRHWRGEQEKMLDLTLSSKNGTVREMVQFGLLFSLTDALGAASSTPAAWFIQFLVGALVGLALALLDGGRILSIVLGTVAWLATPLLHARPDPWAES